MVKNMKKPSAKQNSTCGIEISPEYKKELQQRAEKDYQDNFQFKKPQSARSVVSGYEENYIKNPGDSPYNQVSPKLANMVTAKPSGFGQKRDGVLRTSGKGHQLGKRK